MPESAPPNVIEWLFDNLGDATGALTGTDGDALRAAVAIVPLWLRARNPQVANAWGACVKQMQPTTRWMAYHSTACIGDWSHRAELWEAAFYLPLTPPKRCKHEPR